MGDAMIWHNTRTIAMVIKDMLLIENDDIKEI